MLPVVLNDGTALSTDQRGVRTAPITSANEWLKLLLITAQIPGEVLAANELYSLVVQHRGPVFDTILGSQPVSKLLQRVLFSAWPLQVSQADIHHSNLSFHTQLCHALHLCMQSFPSLHEATRS